MFTLNRSLLFINSEFVVCMFENIEVFFFFNRVFFGKSDLVFLDNWSFFMLSSRTVCFYYVQSAVNQIIRPYFIGSIPSTLSDVSALVVLRYKS